MHTVWKGAIRFGLVQLPVKLHSAADERDVTVRMVHVADAGRIKMQRVCAECGEETASEDIGKAIELPDGQLAVLTDEDLAALPDEASRLMEVLYFAEPAHVDQARLLRPYYLSPDAAGGSGYRLLHAAMAKSGRVAIGRISIRRRQRLAVLRADIGALTLTTMLWPDELRPASALNLDLSEPVVPQELRMARSLIGSMSEPPAGVLTDTYRDAMAALADSKAGNAAPLPAEGTPRLRAVPDLGQALAASLAAAGVPAAARRNASGTAKARKSA